MAQYSALTQEVTHVMVEIFQNETYLTLFIGEDKVNLKHFVTEDRPDFDATMNDLNDRFIIGGEETLIASGFTNLKGKTVYKLA